MAQSNGLNPNFESISLRNGTAVITAGTVTGTAAINALVGTGAVGNGSIYIRSAGAGEIWVYVSGEWTRLTIN